MCTCIHVCVLPVHVCAHVCVTRACIHVAACTPRTTFGGGCLFSTMLRQSHVFLRLLCFSRLTGPRASVPASRLTADTCHCTLKCASFRQHVLEAYFFFKSQPKSLSLLIILCRSFTFSTAYHSRLALTSYYLFYICTISSLFLLSSVFCYTN